MLRLNGPADSSVTFEDGELSYKKLNCIESAGGPWLKITSGEPLAVKMSTFRAADPAVNWPLVAGLGALAAAVIGGLAVARRRGTTH